MIIELELKDETKLLVNVLNTSFQIFSDGSVTAILNGNFYYLKTTENELKYHLSRMFSQQPTILHK